MHDATTLKDPKTPKETILKWIAFSFTWAQWDFLSKRRMDRGHCKDVDSLPLASLARIGIWSLKYIISYNLKPSLI